MKKILILILILLAFMLYPMKVKADTGPKPSITICFENVKSTNYVVDLLVKDLDTDSNQNKNLTALEKIIYNYNVDGWQAKGVRDHLLFKSIFENNCLYFTYFGVPDDFKVIVAYPDGSTRISNEIHKSSID